MAADREEVHEEEVCTYCTTAFEEKFVVVFIVRPSGLHAHACTWSNYKNHNTAKGGHHRYSGLISMMAIH